MMRSLFSGVSGIKVHQTRMDVIGNNIANINTIGFKGSRTTFSDMLSQMQSAAASATDTRGGINPRQVGLGVNVESIDLMFGDSSPQSTGKNTDLALAGNGLFYLKEGNQSYYTRNGSFMFDENGYYVMSGTGFRVQGWNATSDGEINTNGAATDIIVPVGKTMEASETTRISYNGNLDKESKVIKSINYTPASDGDVDKVATRSSYYNTEITINLSGDFADTTLDGTIVSTNQYYTDDDIRNEISVSYERGNADAGNPGQFFYNAVFKDAEGNEIARTTSNQSYSSPPIDLPEITTAVASADSTENTDMTPLTTSVNIDGENVVAATITFRDGTTQTVTSGYYEVGKSMPITTLATIYDSLGGKHEVTLLLDKDPDTAGGDATPIDADAIASGRKKYTYFDDTNSKETMTLPVNDISVSSDGTTYTKTYSLSRTGTAGAYIYTNKETGHVLSDTEALTVEGDETTGFRYTVSLDIISAETVYDNRWRAYISPGVGEKGPAAGDDFTNSYTRSSDNGNAEADGSSTTGTMNFVSYIYFNDKGAYLNNGRTEDGSIVFNYGDGNGAASNQAGIDFSGLTQYANSTTSFPTTNGNTAGVLQSVAVDSNGIISGTYTNGLIRKEAQVSVAQFTNAAGLNKVGTTIYSESNNSGTANIRTVADFGLSITSSALEMSNVDLATEFSEMIITQRGFQANSKMTTVSDEMLETLVNMKR